MPFLCRIRRIRGVAEPLSIAAVSLFGAYCASETVARAAMPQADASAGKVEGPCATTPSAVLKPGKTFDPNNPAAAGYQLVFDDEFNDLSSIDLSNTVGDRFHWYLRDPFRGKAMPADNLSAKHGVLTIAGSGGTIQTFARAPGPQQFVGQVFGGGGYFEARFTFDPATVTKDKGWPAFWGVSFRHSLGDGSDQWPGQPKGYTHYIEDDFFEYDTSYYLGPNSYGSAVHDWYGIWNVTCKPFCQVFNRNNYRVRAPEGTDWKQFHVTSQLWTAGTSGNGWQGHITNYFDGKPTTAALSWVDSGDGVPPPSGNSTFSIIDKDRLILLLSTGKDEPFQVDWVHVWQAPAVAKNDKHPAVAPQKGFTGGNGSCPATK